MRKLFILTRVQLCSILFALSASRKKYNACFMLTLLALSFISLFSLTGYSLLSGLSSVGLAFLFLPIMSLLVVSTALSISAFSAIGILFREADHDFLAAMPVSTSIVALSKLAALYLQNLFLVLVCFLPLCFLYAHKQGLSVVLALSLGALSAIPLASASTLLCFVVALLFTVVLTRFPQNRLLRTITSLAFTIFLVFFSFQLSSLPLWIDSNQQLLQAFLGSSTFLNNLLAGNLSALLPVMLGCLLMLALTSWILIHCYPHLSKRAAMPPCTTKARTVRIAKSSPAAALFKKEALRYFEHTTYLINTAIGPILWVMGVGFLCVSFQQNPDNIIFATNVPSFAMLLVLSFSLSTYSITSVSISLEGKHLWIALSSPVKPAHYFGAKIALQMVVCIPFALICAVLSFVFGVFTMMESIAFLLFSLICVGVNAVAGLWLNLFFPKLNCPNETVIIKQSLSFIATMLGSMVLFFSVSFCIYALSNIFGLLGALWIACTGLLAAFFVLWKLLCQYGTLWLLSIYART